MSITECSDLAEAISLEPSLGLYLKPFSRIKINVQIPRLNSPGQSISSYHVMEKVKETVWPDTFNYLKTLKIASNIMKLEGELETKASCERALSRLKTAGSFKVNGFAEKLQIRAAHAAVPGPTRHDWEAFFRDAKGVNEMKPGERPDTIHLEEVPVKWFLDSGKSSKPSTKLLQRAFGSFGKIRRLEVKRREEPKDSSTIGKTGSLHSDLVFEVYIQYEEYVEFSIAMDSLRGKKLLYKDTDGKVYAADIKVDFDRTNYLSDRCIKQRETEAQKLNPTVLTEKAKSVKEVPHRHSKRPSSEKEHIVKKIGGEGCNPEDKQKIKSTFTEHEKTSKEAKMLLKELLLRAEKHKRNMDKKSQPPEKSHKHEKDLMNSQNSKSEHFKVNKSKKNHLEFHENKLDEIHSKTAPHSLHSKKNSLKRSLDEQTDLKPIYTSNIDIKKPFKKNKSSLELQNNCDSKPSISEVQKTKINVSNKDERREGEKHSKDKLGKQNKHANSNEKNIESGSKEYKSKEKHSAIPDKSEIKLQYSNKTEINKRPANLPDEDKIKRQRLILQERLLKERLLQNLKAREEEKLKHREKLRKDLAGRKVLKSVLADKNHSPCKKH